jgi:hypothetical protein
VEESARLEGPGSSLEVWEADVLKAERVFSCRLERSKSASGRFNDRMTLE